MNLAIVYAEETLNGTVDEADGDTGSRTIQNHPLSMCTGPITQIIYISRAPGVNAVAGKTHRNRSYEISIELSILGNKARDLPESFELWYKILDGAPDGPDNYYPDTYFSWKFEEEHITPTFHVPELPIGTIMALITMFLAMAIFMKLKFDRSIFPDICRKT